MRFPILAAILVAGCSYSAPPPTTNEFAIHAAAAIRGSDYDRALFCGADPDSVIAAAKTQPPPPRILPVGLTQDYRELLVARVHMTVNLRGSNAENPECIALKSRPDLPRLCPVETSTSPNVRSRARATGG